MRHWFLIGLLSVVVAGCALASGGSSSSSSSATVVRVLDGDTVDVRVDGRRERVRLFGVDAPESTTLRTGSVECGGAEAGRALERLLPRGARVRLVRDRRGDAEDGYGRLLRYVERRDGGDAGEAVVRAGWARVFRFRGNRFDRVDRYDRAARVARDDGRGVHRRCGGFPER